MTEREWNDKLFDLLGDVHAVCGLLSMRTTEIAIVDRNPEGDGTFPFGTEDLGGLSERASQLLNQVAIWEEKQVAAFAVGKRPAEHAAVQRDSTERITAVKKYRRVYQQDRCMDFLCEMFDADRGTQRAECQSDVAAFLIAEGVDAALADCRARDWCDLYLVTDDLSEEAQIVAMDMDYAVYGLLEECTRNIDPEVGY
jgi:hypothetical protein